MNNVGGRKFILSMCALFSATALVACHRISDGVYSAVIACTVGAYIAGNVAQRINSSPTTKETK
jgi:hypothetical protein